MKKKFRKVTAVLLTVVMVLGMIMTAPITASAVSKSANEAINWCASKVGQSLDYDGAYGAQCVDLIMYYYQFLGVSGGGGNACDYTSNALPSGFTRTAGGKPQKGDILIYTGGYGHVAIYDSDNVSYHQNWNGQYVQRVERYYGNSVWVQSEGVTKTYWGCIHPNFSGGGNNPEGVVDIIEGNEGKIHVRGWAFDRDNFGAQIPVHVYIGGRSGDSNAEGHAITANTQRTDVNSVYGCGNYHGFDAEISTSKRGSQPIYIYAINTGAGNDNPLIGSGTVKILDYNVPLLEDVRISQVSSKGYRVSCKISSEYGVGIAKFPTWTSKNGQDDLIWHDGTVCNNYITCYINASDHNNEQDGFITHIYVNDKLGQQSSFRAPVVDLTDNVTELDSKVYNGKKYVLYNHDFTWTEAKEWCEDNGGHLATIQDEDEWETVKSLLKTHGGVPVWLGAEGTSGTWKWVTGEEITFDQWSKGEPNCANNKEYYLGTYNPLGLLDCFEWNDYSNSGYIGGFICEYDNFDFGLSVTVDNDESEITMHHNSIAGATIHTFNIYNSKSNKLVQSTSSIPDNEMFIKLNNGHYYINITTDNGFVSDDVYFIINKAYIGDSNRDGNTNILDVTAIQRHLSEIESLNDEQLAVSDVDGNGVVNIDDATLIQMYLAEYDVTLG